jgi:hypothetical protein
VESLLDINELLVSAYLEHVLGCDMVETHAYIGERADCIDVIGVNTRQWKVYVCEVENHLLSSKTVVGQSTANHVDKCVTKFRHITRYSNQRYEGFEKSYMLWTPVIAEHNHEFVRNPNNDLNEIVTLVKIECGVELEVIANEKFNFCLKELRYAVGNTKKLFHSPVLRFIQMEEQLKALFNDGSTALVKPMPQSTKEDTSISEMNMVSIAKDQ